MNYLFAFLTSATITISFRGPIRAIPAAGLAGMVGYAAFHMAGLMGAPEMLAAFIGALLIGITGEMMARLLKEPALLFIVPGLFPLVPGLMAYHGMLHLAREELASAGQVLTRTLFYAGALAAGLALPPAVFRRRAPRNDNPSCNDR